MFSGHTAHTIQLFFVIGWENEKCVYICTRFDKNEDDSVAQLVEQYTFNVWVLGSNPSRIT